MTSNQDKHAPLLVVDDDRGLLLLIKTTLISAGMPEAVLVSDSRQVMDLIRTGHFHVVLLDLNMPHLGGMELLQQIKSEFPAIECIVVTAIDDVPTAIQAMKFGAYDYIVKPLKSERLIIVIRHALEKYNLRQERTLFDKPQSFGDLQHPEAFKEMVARDDAMARVFRQAEVVAPTDYSVVIIGESGTGKEMLANVIHRLSTRARAPFLAVNMASFSQTLFEDQFFGHTKGAYTDAQSEKKGFFESARGGTLFLDEIAELELPLQGKLLRVLEEREIYRLGSTEARNVDVRIIAATNRDISAEIHKGNFRSDLFYRLNMYNIHIPPLRERPKDILPLARHFLRIHARANNKTIADLSTDLAQRLKAYPYPGNVREMNNIIGAAVLLEKTDRLTLDASRNMAPKLGSAPAADTRVLTLAQLEKQHIRKVLLAAGGNRAEAAKLLGINTTTVYRKIEKYRLDD